MMRMRSIDNPPKPSFEKEGFWHHVENVVKLVRRQLCFVASKRYRDDAYAKYRQSTQTLL